MDGCCRDTAVMADGSDARLPVGHPSVAATTRLAIAVDTTRPRDRRGTLCGFACQVGAVNHPPHRHVTDADTVVVQNGQKVRLVQIDTPEVYFGTECRQASTTTKRLAGSVDRSLAPSDARTSRGARSRHCASANLAASSNEVSSKGTSVRSRSSRAIVGLLSPSISGRATEAPTGVTR